MRSHALRAILGRSAGSIETSSAVEQLFDLGLKLRL